MIFVIRYSNYTYYYTISSGTYSFIEKSDNLEHQEIASSLSIAHLC